MMVRIFTVLLIILNTLFAVAQQNFQTALQDLLSQPEYKYATVGIKIVDVFSGNVIFGLNEDKLMIPASTMKLVTTAAALEILGADYCFTTKIGYSGEIKDKKLNGDLVVVGGGDPALGSEFFRNEYENPEFLDVWAQKIKAAGISEVKGDLILDGSLYDDENIPPTWIWEDMGNYYGAGASALTVYDNLFRITFSSPANAEEPTKIVSTFPKMEDINISNKVLSSNVAGDQAYVFGSPLDNKREITGTIPKNRKSYTIKAAVHHPEKLLAEDFIRHLANAGIFVMGKVRFEKVDAKKFQAVYIQESPTLADIIKVLNYESVNLFAEHLVKQIAAEKIGQGSRPEGIEIIKNFWQEKGIDAKLWFMEDGSGLSHFNTLSPSQFTEVLKFMNNQSENNEVFLNSLPGAGNGTLSGFSAKIFPGKTLQAKSGSMTRVRCYAGYLQTNSGRKVVFSIMFNQFLGSQSKLGNEIEKLILQVKQDY